MRGLTVGERITFAVGLVLGLAVMALLLSLALAAEFTLLWLRAGR